MKTREQNRNNKQTEIEQFDWSIERIQTYVAFGWLNERSGKKSLCPRTFQKSIDTSLSRHTATRLANQTKPSPYKGFFGGKTKSPCFDLVIHWLMTLITNSSRNHFSRSYENRSISPEPSKLPSPPPSSLSYRRLPIVVMKTKTNTPRMYHDYLTIKCLAVNDVSFAIQHMRQHNR